MLYTVFLLTLLSACTAYDHPDLEPRQVGWRADRDLTSYRNTDSMLLSLQLLGSTRHKLDSLLEWTDLMNYPDKEIALVYANEAYTLAVEKGYRFSQALSMYYRALLKSRMQIYGEGIEDALADARISHRLLLPSDDPAWAVRIKGLLGYLYYRNRRFELSFVDSARYYADQAIRLIDRVDLPDREVAYMQGQLFQDKAYTYSDSNQIVGLFEKSIAAAAASNNPALQAAIWRGFGNYYMGIGDFEKSDSALLNSKEYALLSGDTSNIVYTFQKLGDLRGRQYLETGDRNLYREGMNYLQRCLLIEHDNLFYTYEMLGINLYEKFAQEHGYPPTGYAIEADSAILYLQLAIEEAKKEGVFKEMKIMVINLAELCEFKQQLTNEDCRTLLNDQDFKAFLNSSYTALVDTIRHDLLESNARIRYFEQREQASANRNRLFRNWLLSGSALALAVIIFLVLLQLLQRKRFQARMEALRAQINPHFISNSLNAIESLVNLNQREAASKYLIHFSRLSRRILNSSRNAVNSLAEELQTLKHFLELEQLRFRDKLSYEIDVSSGIVPELIEIPALLLQPYVENAIWHGIKPKSDPGKLKIVIERQDKSLVCIVEDDGVGREKAREIKQRSTFQLQKSQGMKINEERLEIVGRTKGAKVEVIDLIDTAGNPIGTRVVIRLPFKLRKKEMKASS